MEAVLVHPLKGFNPTFVLVNAEGKKRGVAVLVSKRTLFTLSKNIRDSKGWYILVKSHITGVLFSIISNYAPNKGQVSFFSFMLTFLSPYLEGKVIMGDDYNVAFDHLLDKSSQGRTLLKQPPKQSLRIARLFHSLGMIDTWRELHPTDKDYTHFSAPHRTYARIDDIFLHSSDIHLASQASLSEVPWSDHSLVTLKMIVFLYQASPPPVALWWDSPH